LHSDNNDLGAKWSIRSIIIILSFYLILLLPGKNIFFHTSPWIFKYTDTIYFFVVILLSLYRQNIKVLGFSSKHLKKNLLIGSIIGGVLILSLFLINLGVDLTELRHHDLLKNQPNRSILFDNTSIIDFTNIVLVVPLIEQIFFTGIIFQSLLKKINPLLAIYAAGIIYSLAGFKLSLGAFVLGVTTALLCKITKSLYASIIFHVSCAFGGVIIKSVYPRLKTLLGFLL
jgi:membrane protease YdiL (CAAX protease family)